jgi:TRAP-type uncharacterized transport system fused permease subunit
LLKGEAAPITDTAIDGIIGLAAGVQYCLRRETLLRERIVLIVGDLLLAYPDVRTGAIGVIITAMATRMHLRRVR